MKKFLFIVLGIIVIAYAFGDPKTGKEPWLTSSGGCKTDHFGETKCSYESKVGSTVSTSESKCRMNPVTDRFECSSDFNVR